MSHFADAFVRSWPAAPWLTAGLSAACIIYVRGWSRLHRRDPERWPVRRLAAYLGGLGTIFLALASPIEAFASLLFSVHMVQHLLLMVAAPPLLWLGRPLFPMLRGLPEPVRRYWVVPLLRWTALRRTASFLTHPYVAWPLFVATTWLWHTPGGYELALASDRWHVVEHACFLGSALLFWYPVVQPYPARSHRMAWFVFPYLLLADVQNTLLAAWLTFSPGVLYPHYQRIPQIAGWSALKDQRLGGVLMWVPGSVAYLLPLFVLGLAYLIGTQRRVPRLADSRFLSGRQARRLPGDMPLLARPRVDVGGTPGTASAGQAVPVSQAMFSLPGRCSGTSVGVAFSHVGTSRRAVAPGTAHRAVAPSSQRFDLLCLPGIGRLLRWRYVRHCLQLLLATLALCVVVDGLTGPQVAPLNLAGVLPWIHWRGVLILSLLVAGNVFCMACPFTLPRSIARRWLPGGRPWPQRLRNKWLAAGLVAVFLWSYEAFSLWDSPWVTAWIAAGYFVAAFVVDSLFAGSAFCRYVCPIGQFNFVQSLTSPTEVTVREPSVCASCTTHECLRGSETEPGCGMQLFQPQKVGNLDCTFCLDCVRACPHDNVGVLAVVPGRSLWTDLRTGSGRFRHRPDVAALVLILTFGAFANAAGMIAPVVEFQNRLHARFDGLSRLATTSGFYLLAIVVVPLVCAGTATWLSNHWSGVGERPPATSMRYIFALAPIGFGMWLAHYSYHFFTSWDTMIPATQRFAADHGIAALGTPRWACACCQPAADWVLQSQILMLDFGLLVSLYAGFRIAEGTSNGLRQAGKSFAPWASLIVLLFVLGVWIILQPMEMRGTLPASA